MPRSHIVNWNYVPENDIIPFAEAFSYKYMNTKTISPIYLDYQATTPVEDRVLDAMMPHFSKQYGNPHSNDHWFGWQSKKAVDTARKSVADFMNSDPDEVIFTSGATEANNIAVLGTLDFLKKSGKSRIIVSSFEHKCVLESAKAAKRQGFEVTFLKPNADGFVTPASLADIIDDRVGFVSVMMVNNEIGTVQPVAELAAIAHSVGALFHTDAAQAGVFLKIDVEKIDVDLLSLSGHKIYGPKGIGILFIKREIQNAVSPLIYGGGQESGFRSGTLPTMLCVGLGKACEIMATDREQNAQHLQKLSSLFWDLISTKHLAAVINGSLTQRHPGNLNIAFTDMDAHSLLQALQPNVAASTGSACTTGTPEPSHVLRAIGLSDDRAEASVRFSFGIHDTEEDIRRAATYITNTLSELH